MLTIFGKLLRASFSPWLLIFASLLGVSVLAGWTASAGKLHYLVPVLALLSLPFVARTGSRWRGVLFFLLPILVSFQMPELRLPLGVPPLVLVMAILTAVEILFLLRHNPANLTDWFEYLPLAILLLGAGGAAYLNSDIHRWYIFPAPLFFLFFLSKRYLRSQKEAGAIFRVLYFSVIFYVGLIMVMRTFGQIEYVGQGWNEWRLFGRGETITLGPLSTVIFSIEFGTVAGLGFVLAFFELLQKNLTWLRRAIFLISLLVFGDILIQTAARGATIATLVSTACLFSLVRRGNSKLLLGLIFLGGIALLFQDLIFSLIAPEIFQRFMELEGGITEVRTFQYRLDLMTVTLRDFPAHPFGVGYSYLWNRYRLDESLLFSSILNGTGLIGMLGFALWMLQLLGGYLKGLTLNHNKSYPALGLAVWLFIVLNGLVSSSVVLDPVVSFLFWATAIAAHQASMLPEKS